MPRRFPLHTHISTLFLALLLIIGGVIGSLGYKISGDILSSTASELSLRIGRETQREFTSLFRPAEMAARLLRLGAITQAGSLEQRLENLGVMREALINSSELTSLYVGYANGDFFLFRRLWNDGDREYFAAPPQASFIVQSIEHVGDKPRGHFIFLDSALSTLRRDERPDYARSYDPRTRDWYKAARLASGQIKTAPYLFFTTRKVGTTIANRAFRGDAVIGADIDLETLNQTLARQKITPGTQMVLVNREGKSWPTRTRRISSVRPRLSMGNRCSPRSPNLPFRSSRNWRPSSRTWTGRRVRTCCSTPRAMNGTCRSARSRSKAPIRCS